MTQELLTPKITKLCLVAGNGELPVALAKSAKNEGVELVIFALSGDNFKELKNYSENTFRFSVVDVYRMLDKAKELSCKNISFIGKVPKLDFFKSLHRLDSRLLRLIDDLADWNDDSLHHKIAEFVKQEAGLAVIDQTIFLKDYFPDEQCFTERKLDPKEIDEAKFALKMAKEIGKLDIGQTVIVNNKSVIAVEAIEGTNACIKRAVEKIRLQKNKKITIAKTSKPNQDRRFDMPTIGLETIKAMPKGSNLVFEANETFFVNQLGAIQLANKKNISITSFRLGE